ncbi:hypothetical protein K227x_14660 [Rubripirellula lacrimiformis]|uniref:Uncharacterized protein n=1 Tax=Rubripirellula lacrimiformis TaxID=1930273 RepID=A0A517N7G8_9BACT|nr:hypothetical protein [Rubripirellula lacrimiformis]QDT03086.1 hypothetical protein K227x_14660 [Rubripirellula lacrimiformis]
MIRSGPSVGLLVLHFSGCFIFSPWLAIAEDRMELGQIVRDAADELNPDALPTRVECATEFAASVTEATDFVSSPSFEASGAGWLDYLQLAAMADAVESEVGVHQQIELASELRRRLIGPIPGVELSPLVKLREQAECYRLALACSDREPFIRHLRTQLIEVAEQLEASRSVGLSADPSTDPSVGTPKLTAKEIRLVSQVIARLSAFHQSGANIDRIRRIFSHPNCVLTFSEGFVQQAIARSIVETRPINDCILGTRIVGQANVHATVSVDLQPSDSGSRLTLHLDSQMTNRSRGYHGPVAMNMVGGGSATASRTLLLSDHGVAFQQVQVQANLTNQIQSVDHPLPIVRRIAKQRAAKQKPQSDRIAKSRVEAQIRDQFTKQTDSAGTMRPDDLLEPLRPWLRRFAVSEPDRTWGSTDQSLFIQGRLLHDDQLASPVAPPACSADYDVAIQVHETCANNVLKTYMSGKTFSEENIDLLAWLNGRGPLVQLPIEIEVKAADHVAIEVHPITPKFQIKLAVESPVFFEAREGRVVMGAHLAHIVEDGTAPIHDIELRATYRPQRQSDGHYHLAREHEINVDGPGTGGLNEKQKTLLAEVRDAVQRALPLQIADQYFMLPSQVPVAAFKDRHFRPSVMEAQDGWLTIAVR